MIQEEMSSTNPTAGPDRNFPLQVPDTRFDQRNEMFKRRTRDEGIRPAGDQFYSQMRFQEKCGYRKLDYALRNAAWNIEYGYAFGNMRSDFGMYSWTHVPEKARRFVEAGPFRASAEENTGIVKKAARFLCADLVGIGYGKQLRFQKKDFWETE